MDRTSALAIATLRNLRRDERGSVTAGGIEHARTGVVLGTTSGSNRTQFEFTRDSLTRRKPYFVNPAQMPFALMNSAAAQCAMWHGLTGPNSTIAAGRVAGPAVLRYASRLLRTGRAGAVFAGAVEEHSGARELLEPGGPLGEAAVLLFLQTAAAGNRPALAEVLAVDTALDTRRGEPRRALVACLERVLAGLAVDEVWGVATSAAVPELSDVELEATGEVLGRRNVIHPGHLVGDTGAASGVVGVVALLAAAEADPGARGRLAVATSVDRDGTAGAVVLRLAGTRHERSSRSEQTTQQTRGEG